MPDKRILEQLMTMLRGLRAQVRLFDEHGECLSGGESEVLPEFPQMGMAVVRDGWTWIRTMTNAIPYICVEGEDAAASDCARLAAALAESMMREPSATTRDDVLRGALREDMPEPELVTLATEYGIPSDEERCAMLFHGTASVIREVIAVGEGDALVEMDRHALVLIKSMRNIEGYDDLIQLAAAIEQTVMAETGEHPLVSIGECASTLFGLGASYRAAWRALEIGRVYRPNEDVYSYHNLVMERFLSELPPDIGRRYHSLLFNRKTQRLFSEEMLQTIDMFFRKDLNLSDPARQLYIHRNTLVYRLDKIQRQTGLDLRKFDDAITFKTLFLLGKQVPERTTR
ncbi:MAG: helix-turn-helix domain-containing protein [Clostridiales bacterium]|nr:helix-turn-helix domain-containing protein [Clostridiales bacterium]